MPRMGELTINMHEVSRRVGPILFYAAVYVALAELSLSTAYVQVNAATVWIPSGFAIGLLITRGLDMWPAVALGSLVANLLVNIASEASEPVLISTLVAFVIAIGNTAEAVLGAYLADRFAAGADFMSRPRDAARFVFLVAPIPPLISMTIGVGASRLGGFSSQGSLSEVMLTWYIANSVGILIVTGLTVLALTRKPILPRGDRAIEVAALALCLVFFGQAICGIYASEAFTGWPKAYMTIPFLFWASFRFGTVGAQLSIALIMLISVVGTMRGFQAFPADTPSRSLIYLQTFLAMLSIMSLSISSALSEVAALHATLEDKVRIRTRGIEQLLAEREVFTTLIAHDLQSPIFGVRNALRAASGALKSGRISSEEVVEAMRVMEETCSTLAERVSALLAPKQGGVLPAIGERGTPLAAIMENIARAHRLTMEGKSARLRLEGDMKIEVAHSAEIEHILDILVDNALRFTPSGVPVEVAAYRHGANIEILVTDHGKGLSPEQAMTVFQPRLLSAKRIAAETGAGLGLHLASEQAGKLGGRLSYSNVEPSGARFRLVVPV